jgi:GH25 family lysozyme M1 (1,4-beta-N-acetylmuramidase)
VGSETLLEATKVIHGIDVSSYQPHVEWKVVAAAGADFAIVKLTEGNGYLNPLAATQIAGARDAGMFVMGYHFARPNGPNWAADAVAEAAHLLAMSDGMFCFLDVERNEPLTSAEIPLWRAWAYSFRQRCAGQGQPIGWYSYTPFTAAIALEASWEATLLWLARYPLPWRRQGDYEKWPDAPLPWARVDIWQDGGDANGATWPGVTGACDVNRFAGSRAELEELIGSAR